MKNAYALLFFVVCTIFPVACGDDSGTSAGGMESSSSSSGKANWALMNPEISYGELRDGQVYRAVEIGDQIWMAENLNYAYMVKTQELDPSSFCYGNKVENCEKYGRLYLWSAAVDSAALFSENGKGCGDGTVMIHVLRYRILYGEFVRKAGIYRIMRKGKL